METSVPPPECPQQVTAASPLCTPCGIGSLPPEVLMNIFQFFNVQQLDRTISPVCQLWHNLSRRACLRLELALEGEELDGAAACELLRTCPNLKDLSITYRRDANYLLRRVVIYNRELRRLVVNHCTDRPESQCLSEQILDEILLCSPLIVDLAITNSKIQSNKFFCDLGFRLPELRKINFNFCTFFGSDELRMIVFHCGKLEEIRALQSVCCSPPLCDKDMLLVVERLWGTLKVLKIEGHQLSDEGVGALGQCCQLHKLHIRNARKLTDDGVSQLSRLDNLKSLYLTQVEKVTSWGWIQLFSMSRWRQMKKLTLAHCPTVNDNTLHHIATTCRNLVKLTLAGCRLFTDEGLKSVLQTCTDLEDLNIWSTHKYVFRSFSYIPTHTRKLKRLVYKKPGLEEENRVFKSLEEAVPECHIIRV